MKHTRKLSALLTATVIFSIVVLTSFVSSTSVRAQTTPEPAETMKPVSPEEGQKQKELVKKLSAEDRKVVNEVNANGTALATEKPLSETNPGEVPTSTMQDAQTAMKEMVARVKTAEATAKDKSSDAAKVPGLNNQIADLNADVKLWKYYARKANDNTEGWKGIAGNYKKQRDDLRDAAAKIKVPDKSE